MSLDPDLQAFLDLVNAQPMAMAEGEVWQARQSYDRASQVLDELDTRVANEIVISTRDNESIKIRQYNNNDVCSDYAIMFFHGGGYVLGNLDSHHTFAHRLSEQCKCQVFSVDYRLAPEHKFPTAFYDACDAYKWITSQMETEQYPFRNIIVAGDSVGATLATNICIEAKQQIQNISSQWQMPSKQILLYPCTSAYQDTKSHKNFSQGYLLESDNLQWMYAQYLTANEQREDRRFAPLCCDDLSLLPSALIILPEYDPLIDEGQMYASKLSQAGVNVDMQVFAGMTHDFARFGNIVPHTITKLMKTIGQFVLNQ